MAAAAAAKAALAARQQQEQQAGRTAPHPITAAAAAATAVAAATLVKRGRGRPRKTADQVVDAAVQRTDVLTVSVTVAMQTMDLPEHVFTARASGLRSNAVAALPWSVAAFTAMHMLREWSRCWLRRRRWLTSSSR